MYVYMDRDGERQTCMVMWIERETLPLQTCMFMWIERETLPLQTGDKHIDR